MPMAASSLALGRALRVLMMTRYVASRVLTPVIPNRPATWPDAMLMAEPVMKAPIATSGINSTIQPNLMSPKKRRTTPEIRARLRAIASPSSSGCTFCTERMMFPTMVDMTATV